MLGGIENRKKGWRKWIYVICRRESWGKGKKGNIAVHHCTSSSAQGIILKKAMAIVNRQDIKNLKLKKQKTKAKQTLKLGWMMLGCVLEKIAREWHNPHHWRSLRKGFTNMSVQVLLILPDLQWGKIMTLANCKQSTCRWHTAEVEISLCQCLPVGTGFLHQSQGANPGAALRG